jgi:hypothetical protein
MLTKVRQFLAAEATRLSRDLPGRVDQDEAAELVAYRTAGSLQLDQAVTYRTAGSLQLEQAVPYRTAGSLQLDQAVPYRTAGSLQLDPAVTYRAAGPVLSCLHGRPTALCLHEFRSVKP